MSKKRVSAFLSLALVMAMLFSLVCAPAAHAARWNTKKKTATIDRNVGGMTRSERAAYKKLYKMKSKYPEGTPWTNQISYCFQGGYFGLGYGCSAFVFMMSDATFSKHANKRSVTLLHVKDIKVGDIIRMDNNNHSVIVMKVNKKKYTVAEANYGGTIHWGRIITRAEILKTGTYILTRY